MRRIRLVTMDNSLRAIVEALGLGPHFRRVYGGNSFDQKKPNPVGIEQILIDTGTARERTVMVGDSYIDIQTGRNATVATCGVTYGRRRCARCAWEH